MLHQNESQEAASIATAKAICSQATLNAQTICSQSVLEAKTNFLVEVKEAKTNRGCSIQEAEAAYSEAISKAGAQKTSQAMMLHEEHDKYMQGLEEQAFREESRSHHDFRSSCQAALCHSPQALRGALATSYHLLLEQAPCCLHPFCHQGLTLQRNSHPQLLLPPQCPNSLQDQKGDVLCQTQWGAC